MTSRKKLARQQRALIRLGEALNNPDHQWKNHDGPIKAEICKSNLISKGAGRHDDWKIGF